MENSFEKILSILTENNAYCSVNEDNVSCFKTANLTNIVPLSWFELETITFYEMKAKRKKEC